MSKNLIPVIAKELGVELGEEFEPKINEEYWTYADNWNLSKESWSDDAYDYIHKACGCIFRTVEEAFAARPAKYEELTGREWQE